MNEACMSGVLASEIEQLRLQSVGILLSCPTSSKLAEGTNCILQPLHFSPRRRRYASLSQRNQVSHETE
jgi:hypothetical protein